MGIKILRQCFSNFASEPSLRFDYKYSKSLKMEYEDSYSYKDLFDLIPPKKINLCMLDKFKYAEIGNVDNLGEVDPLELSFDCMTNEEIIKKIEKGDIIKPIWGDILIPKIRPYLNKIVLVQNENIYFTKAFIQIRPKINSELLHLLLRIFFIDQINTVSRQGKGYPTLKEEDLKLIKFPKRIINKIIHNENKLIKEIAPLKEQINQLRNLKIQPSNIVNKIFGEILNFNWKLFEREKKQKIYTSKITDFSNNADCRMGYRFHNRSGVFLQSFLKNISNKSIKDFLAESITLGASISPYDYTEDGEYYYIAMSSIKKWHFDSIDCKKVGVSYVKKNQSKTIKKNDILLSRSGEGTIGKVALIEDSNIRGVFSDFTQRIRLHNFDPLCAYYYFTSVFFQHLVYTHKKGMGNNTNIFPSQIERFPIPNWSKKEQAEIVCKIKAELDEQKNIDKQIKEKQARINTIMVKMVDSH